MKVSFRHANKIHIKTLRLHGKEGSKNNQVSNFHHNGNFRKLPRATSLEQVSMTSHSDIVDNRLEATNTPPNLSECLNMVTSERQWRKTNKHMNTDLKIQKQDKWTDMIYRRMVISPMVFSASEQNVVITWKTKLGFSSLCSPFTLSKCSSNIP